MGWVASLAEAWIETREDGPSIRFAIASGARTLDCFDDFLPGFYARFGFVEVRRESNWTPGKEDVVYMVLKED